MIFLFGRSTSVQKICKKKDNQKDIGEKLRERCMFAYIQVSRTKTYPKGIFQTKNFHKMLADNQKHI